MKVILGLAIVFAIVHCITREILSNPLRASIDPPPSGRHGPEPPGWRDQGAVQPGSEDQALQAEEDQGPGGIVKFHHKTILSRRMRIKKLFN